MAGSGEGVRDDPERTPTDPASSACVQPGASFIWFPACELKKARSRSLGGMRSKPRPHSGASSWRSATSTAAPEELHAAPDLSSAALPRSERFWDAAEMEVAGRRAVGVGRSAARGPRSGRRWRHGAPDRKPGPRTTLKRASNDKAHSTTLLVFYCDFAYPSGAPLSRAVWRSYRRLGVPIPGQPGRARLPQCAAQSYHRAPTRLVAACRIGPYVNSSGP